MANFVMLIGIVGCGKSSYAEKIGEGYVILSSDKIREELCGTADNQDKELTKKVFKEMRNRAFDNLRNGNSVIYDATNLNSKRRTDLLNAINQVDGVENTRAIVFLSTPKEAISNQQNRERKVPDGVIYRMWSTINFPSIKEGWDEINYVRIEDFCNE